jgi:hypothetical protein
MNCQQAGKVVCVTNVVPKAVGDESNAYDWTRSHQQGRERSGTLTGQRTGAEALVTGQDRPGRRLGTRSIRDAISGRLGGVADR